MSKLFVPLTLTKVAENLYMHDLLAAVQFLIVDAEQQIDFR